MISATHYTLFPQRSYPQQLNQLHCNCGLLRKGKDLGPLKERSQNEGTLLIQDSWLSTYPYFIYLFTLTNLSSFIFQFTQDQRKKGMKVVVVMDSQNKSTIELYPLAKEKQKGINYQKADWGFSAKEHKIYVKTDVPRWWLSFQLTQQVLLRTEEIYMINFIPI